jgi:hypothetical protein
MDGLKAVPFNRNELFGQLQSRALSSEASSLDAIGVTLLTQGKFGNHGPRGHGYVIEQHSLRQRNCGQQHANYLFAADGGGNGTKCRAH